VARQERDWIAELVKACIHFMLSWVFCSGSTGHIWPSASTLRRSCQLQNFLTRSISSYSTPREYYTPIPILPILLVHLCVVYAASLSLSDAFNVCICRAGIGSSFSKTALLVSTGDGATFERVQDVFSNAGMKQKTGRKCCLMKPILS
jgi:hypothetical protein